MKKKLLKTAVLGMAFAALPLLFLGNAMCRVLHGAPAAQEAEAAQVQVASRLALLSWPQNLEAVRWEVEIFRGIPADLSPDRPLEDAVYRNDQVYMNEAELDMTAFSAEEGPWFFRTRAFDLDGHPVSAWSQPAELASALMPLTRNAPSPRDSMGGRYGRTLLYPVYAYAGNPGAVKFEVEVTGRYPENPDGTAPSRYRVFSKVTDLTDLYDEVPRTGVFYWRVRGLDELGNPVGIWSEPQRVETPTAGWTVGIYGDSISHGGGHLSFSPVDFDYSYPAYLDFPTINLSQSGDTSQMMVDRFDKDVAPFHLKYLLILGGTNSLRAGVPASDVIDDLKTMQRKARALGVTPILMTLPPINPANIDKAFQEPTDPGWRESFREVNDFIRTQPHIDTAAPFAGMDVLPTELALDGLHGDWNAKRMMAEEINRHMREFVPAAELS